jgi:hypothetical protein
MVGANVKKFYLRKSVKSESPEDRKAIAATLP